MALPPTRDAQFANITQLRERFSRRGNPILSVDTKKKRVGRTLQEPRTRPGLKRAMPSTTTTFAPWQMGSQSHTASMISRVIEAPCMSGTSLRHVAIRSRMHREVWRSEGQKPFSRAGKHYLS